MASDEHFPKRHRQINVGTMVTSAESIDAFYLLWSACLVFFMQCGFGMLEAGSVRAKNTKNILLKNLLDACLGALIWFFVGYSFAFGDDQDGGFIGNLVAPVEAQEGDNYKKLLDHWFFNYTFAAACATIVSGCLAERAQMWAYLFYTFCGG